MARIKKRGTAGQAKNYITRTQAVRKLQISLPDFRRLCIFKGIYPREPRSKKKASKSSTPSTTFYYARDIQYLLHEPLLAKFRDLKALSKKITRSLGRGEVGDAARFEKHQRPKLTLDHVIKERYPTFVDALRDLDDALSLIYLYANLPSDANVLPKTISMCQKLCTEFEHYLIATHSLQKSFLSIKGIYYQAAIQGQDIMWLVPYKFVQKVTAEVDLRIMSTFVEFYMTLLGFVNYRLYTSIGLVYPPKLDTVAQENGGDLTAIAVEGKDVSGAVTLEAGAFEATGNTQNGATSVSESLQQEVNLIRDEVDEEIISDSGDQAKRVLENGKTDESMQAPDTIDVFDPIASDADTLPLPSTSKVEISSLFSSSTFFLSREAPKAPLEFLLRAFGCKRISWDAVVGAGAFTNDEYDASITHQIVDRPPHPSKKIMPGRIYVQPQWVWDCINEVKLLRPDLYAPGITLPPHLSPWVKPKLGEYDPRASLVADAEGEEEEEEEEEAEDEIELRLSTESGNGVAIENGKVEEDDEDEDDFAGFDEPSSDVDEDTSTPIKGAFHRTPQSTKGQPFDPDEGGAEPDEDKGDQDAALSHQRELEAEADGTRTIVPVDADSKSSLAMKKKRRSQEQQQAAEELERRKMMLPRKKRKLVEKMLYSNEQKNAQAEALRKKKRKLERQR